MWCDVMWCTLASCKVSELPCCIASTYLVKVYERVCVFCFSRHRFVMCLHVCVCACVLLLWKIFFCFFFPNSFSTLAVICWSTHTHKYTYINTHTYAKDNEQRLTNILPSPPPPSLFWRRPYHERIWRVRSAIRLRSFMIACINRFYLASPTFQLRPLLSMKALVSFKTK